MQINLTRNYLLNKKYMFSYIKKIRKNKNWNKQEFLIFDKSIMVEIYCLIFYKIERLIYFINNLMNILRNLVI